MEHGTKFWQCKWELQLLLPFICSSSMSLYFRLSELPKVTIDRQKVFATVWLFIHLLTWVCTWLSLKWHCSTLIIQCWVSLISSWNSQPGITVNAHWSPYGLCRCKMKTLSLPDIQIQVLFWDVAILGLVSTVDWRLDLQTWDMLRVHIRDLLVPDECVHVRHNTYVTGETHVTAACP